MRLKEITDRTAKRFFNFFDREPRWIAIAPGRVNIIGEHTDYNEGFVLPMAIDRYTVIAGDTNNDLRAQLHSITTGETADIGSFAA